MLNAKFLTGEELTPLGFRKLGQNVRIHETVVLVGCDRMDVGDNVRLDPYAVLSAGDSLSIGRNVHIAAHCIIAGSAPIEICDFAGVSHGSKILSATDDFSKGYLSGPTVPPEFTNVISEPVCIGKHAVIGANSVILPGVDLGDGVAVGALSLVRVNVEPWKVVVGTPARVVGTRPNADVVALEKEYTKSGIAPPA